MVFGLSESRLYADDDHLQWSADEEEDDKVLSSGEESEIETQEEEPMFSRANKRLDEVNFDLIENDDVRAIVEMTNKREKEVFTGKGKEFAYPTEWKDERGCGRIRLKIHIVMDGLLMRTIAMLLVLVDVILVIIEVTTEKGTGLAGHIMSLVIVSYFLVDLILTVFAWGKTFFKDWIEIFDGVVVVVAFIVTVTIEIIQFTTRKKIKLFSLIVILRFVRFSLYLRILYHTAQSIYMAVRYKATQSKKRYVQDGYDLDLTYITSNVIAMSFPSSGAGEIKTFPPTKVDMELAIRNPKADVARFFNEKYPNGRYKIYNLCKERGYDTSIFHDQVARFKIDDHNVPKMSELLDFCRDVEKFMSANKDNVVAVHCKGGKGRTGCCIASWLLYSGQWKTAKGALDYFAGRRMDIAKGVKFQGVETPSQKRYVYYLEKLMKRMGGELPPDTELLLKSIEIRGLDVSLYNDLRMEIVMGDQTKYKKVLVTREEKNTKRIVRHFEEAIRLAGDIKFRFKSQKLGKDYDNCAFFFWLHTSFIERNRFYANRWDIGNANKPKHNDKYNEQFKIKLVFTDPLRTRRSSSLFSRSLIKKDTVIDIQPEKLEAATTSNECA